MKKLIFTLVLLAGIIISAQAQVVEQRHVRPMKERRMERMAERRKIRRVERRFHRRHRRRMVIQAFPANQLEMAMLKKETTTVLM